METVDKSRTAVWIGCVCTKSGPCEMTAYALGSCIALCLYDPDSDVGAMAHILLPSGRFSGNPDNPYFPRTDYADHALEDALEQMQKLGADRTKIKAAIVGGAKMFPYGADRKSDIGEMNALSIISELSKNKIPLEYSATGGSKSRTVTFRIPGDSFETQIQIRQ